MGYLRGAIAPLLKQLPLPLIKGKGIKGMRLINNPAGQRLDKFTEIG